MAFSDFKNIEQVIHLYPLEIRQERFIADVHLELSELFIDDINFALERKAVFESEAFFSESFIFPFLLQAWKRHPTLKLWSHRLLAYDEKLFGEPDYFVSMWREGVIDKLVHTPLLIVTEAKKQDFEGGWGQCLAEMIACQKINMNERLTVYGMVSTGIVWEFGKLHQSIFTKHPLSYTISDPQKIFGMIDWLFAECERQVQEEALAV